MREMSQLRWRCRRGMRELDLLVGGWLENNYESASADQKAGFRKLLDSPDPQLLAWLTGRDRPADPILAQLVDAIRQA